MLTTFRLIVLVTIAATVVPGMAARPALFDVPLISHYSGTIGEETEMAYLDNLAIQMMNDPEMIGYILVYSGADSCAGEAQARVMRMKNYLTEARGVPWNRVMWKDGGRFRSQGLDIYHYGVSRSQLATFGFAYEPIEPGKMIRRCRHRPTSKRTI